MEEEKNWTRNAQHAFCDTCGNLVTTFRTFETGKACWFSCCFLVSIGWIFGCCLIPFVIDDLKDITHFCPRCRIPLGKSKLIEYMASFSISNSIEDESLFFLPAGSLESPILTGREKVHFRFESFNEESESYSPGEIITYEVFTPPVIRNQSEKVDKSTNTETFEQENQSTYEIQNEKLREELLANTREFKKLVEDYEKLSDNFSEIKEQSEKRSELLQIMNITEEICEEEPSKVFQGESKHILNCIISKLEIIRSREIRLISENTELSKHNEKLTLDLQSKESNTLSTTHLPKAENNSNE